MLVASGWRQCVSPGGLSGAQCRLRGYKEVAGERLSVGLLPLPANFATCCAPHPYLTAPSGAVWLCVALCGSVTRLNHLTGSLSNSSSRHPQAGGAAPPRLRLPCKNRLPTGLAPIHCAGGVILHPSCTKRLCARPDVAAGGKQAMRTATPRTMGPLGDDSPPAKTPVMSSPGATRPDSPQGSPKATQSPKDDEDDKDVDGDEDR